MLPHAMLSHSLARPPASRALPIPSPPFRAPINNPTGEALPHQLCQSICYSQRPHHVPETSRPKGESGKGKLAPLRTGLPISGTADPAVNPDLFLAEPMRPRCQSPV